MRVCLDTNVLVAAFATRGLCTDILRECLSEHALVIGEFHLEELRRVLRKKLRLSDDRVEAAVAVFDDIDIVPRPEAALSISIRDPDDKWILATAVAGNAEILVTGDDDLLSVAADCPISIVTPRAFWQSLRSDGENASVHFLAG